MYNEKKKTKIALLFIFPSKTNLMSYHRTHVGLPVRNLFSETSQRCRGYYFFFYYFKDFKKKKKF
jgi:hypothetical protein